jgi:hypothetical protein
MDREPTIPSEIAPRTSDLMLVQALAETRTAARRRSGQDDHTAAEDGDPGAARWRSIADRADRVLAAIGVVAPEAGHTPAIGFDRIDRTALDLDAGAADRLAATLRALHDRPDDVRLEAADRALGDLADRLA